MSIDNLVDFLQIYHATDQTGHKQCLYEAAEKFECKSANCENDGTNNENLCQEKSPWGMTSLSKKHIRITTAAIVLAIDM